MPIQNVLCCFAHPDDETIMIGGTLAMLHEQGIQTHVICATRGEGGEPGEPPVSTQDLLGAARTEELRCAALQLGVTSLTLLGYIDPAIGPGAELSPFDADFDTLVNQIMAHITETEADAVLAHGPDGEYGHPAHKLIYRATLQAAHNLDTPVPFYSVAATVPSIEDRLWNESRMAHFALDITPWAEAKVAAMECHVSQHALFKRRRKLTYVRESLRSVESVYREWPAVNGSTPDDPFADLLRSIGAETPTQ